jgi:uncharacterized caspase-like protein
MLVFALLLSYGSTPGVASGQTPHKEAPGGTGTRWAVIIGVEKYSDPTIPSLRYARSDARAVEKTLISLCGYEPDHVLVMTDDADKDHLKPELFNLQEQIRLFLENPQKGDSVFVYFSGHGFLDDRGQGYLAPKNCKPRKLGLTALRTEDLREMLRQCEASQKVLILDCCHSGGAKDGAGTGSTGQELAQTLGRSEGLVTLASCRKDEQSREWDEKQQGLFTYCLRRGLEGEADRDGDGVVDSLELYRYTREKVRLTAQRELNAIQTPVLINNDEADSNFPLASVKVRARVAETPTDTRINEGGTRGDQGRTEEPGTAKAALAFMPPGLKDRPVVRSSLVKLAAMRPLEEIVEYPRSLKENPTIAEEISRAKFRDILFNFEPSVDRWEIYLRFLSQSRRTRKMDVLQTCASLAWICLLASEAAREPENRRYEAARAALFLDLGQELAADILASDDPTSPGSERRQRDMRLVSNSIKQLEAIKNQLTPPALKIINRHASSKLVLQYGQPAQTVEVGPGEAFLVRLESLEISYWSGMEWVGLRPGSAAKVVEFNVTEGRWTASESK